MTTKKSKRLAHECVAAEARLAEIIDGINSALTGI